jgi:hypothetical protein
VKKIHCDQEAEEMKDQKYNAFVTSNPGILRGMQRGVVDDFCDTGCNSTNGGYNTLQGVLKCPCKAPGD